MPEVEYASKGVAGAGLGTGIAGLSLSVLNAMNGLGGLFGRGTGDAVATGVAGAIPFMANAFCHGDSGSKPISRYEFNQSLNYERQLENKNNEIMQLMTDNKLKDSEIYTDKKSLELYTYVDGRLREIEKTQADNEKAQAIVNTAVNASITAVDGKVNQALNTLSQITQTKVPNSAVCPGWGPVCVTPNPCGCDCNNGTSLY